MICIEIMIYNDTYIYICIDIIYIYIHIHILILCFCFTRVFLALKPWEMMLSPDSQNLFAC